MEILLNNELLDSWFLSSIRNYSVLHMYELQQPTAALTWTSSESICVACLLENGRSEILELKLPRKIILKGEQQDLCKERDFKVISGGFHEQHIKEILYLNSSSDQTNDKERFICASENDLNCVSVWQLGSEDSDLITQKYTLQNGHGAKNYPARMCTAGSHTVIHGSHINNLCQMDIEQGKNIHLVQDILNNDELSNISCIDEQNFIISSAKDHLVNRIDFRQKHQKLILTEKHEVACRENSCLKSAKITHWTCAHSNTGPNKGSVMKLSSSGDIVSYDMRNLAVPVTKTILSEVEDAMHKGKDTSNLIIQISPSQAGYTSISGINGHINVYKESGLFCNSESLKPMSRNSVEEIKIPHFVHKGHIEENEKEALNINNHMCHPLIENLLLSCDDNGGLHAWQYVQV